MKNEYSPETMLDIIQNLLDTQADLKKQIQVLERRNGIISHLWMEAEEKIEALENGRAIKRNSDA